MIRRVICLGGACFGLMGCSISSQMECICSLPFWKYFTVGSMLCSVYKQNEADSVDPLGNKHYMVTSWLNFARLISILGSQPQNGLHSQWYMKAYYHHLICMERKTKKHLKIFGQVLLESEIPVQCCQMWSLMIFLLWFWNKMTWNNTKLFSTVNQTYTVSKL